MDEDDRRRRLEALFARYAPMVLAYARRRTGSALADDVLSDVFLVAWRRIDALPDDPKPWLLACARRAVANHARGERRRVNLVARLAAEIRPDEPSIELHDGLVAWALARLGARDREVLLLTAWEGLTAEEAARVIGCSPPTFRVRAHRARKRFARALRAADAPTDAQLMMEA